MRMVSLVIFVFLLPSALYAESYLCITDLSTGFAFDKQRKTWTIERFNPKGKYILTASEKDPSKWEVREPGDKMPSAWCEGGFSVLGALRCDGFIDFRMNKHNLRFVSTYLAGFWTDNIPRNIPGAEDAHFIEGDNTPYIQIGKCSLFSP